MLLPNLPLSTSEEKYVNQRAQAAEDSSTAHDAYASYHSL